MKEKRISFGQGKGSIAHNNRDFVADNVDPFRTPDNVTFVCQPIAEAYDRLFVESTERYNQGTRQLLRTSFWCQAVQYRPHRCRQA